MTQFAKEEELQQYLEGINPNYAEDASRIWGGGVRCVDELANAAAEDLVALGINKFRVSNIIQHAKAAVAPTAAPADSSPHKLDTTSTAFFQSLATALKATSAGNVVLDVNPSHVHPVTVEGTMSKIFVRPCYQKLWDAIRATTLVRSHIVTGTPGIGKSFFMYYCFWALVRGPGTAASAPVSAILWEHHRSPGKMWMYRNGQVLVGDRKAFDCELDAPSSWYFADGVAPLAVAAHQVLISSPNRAIYKDLEKAGAYKWFMPVWTWEELQGCRAAVFPSLGEERALELYTRYGGVARYVLGHPFLKPQATIDVLSQSLDDALAQCNIEQVKASVGAIDAGPEASNRVLHIMVDPGTFNKRCVSFASPYVADKFIERFWQAEKLSLLSNMNATGGQLKGLFFEPVMHRLLAEGGDFLCVELDANTLKRMSTPPTAVHIGGGTVKWFDDWADLWQAVAPNESTYWRPRKTNFPTIDSLLLPQRAYFQMTVSPSKPIDANKLKAAVDGDQSGAASSSSSTTLYFVVPDRATFDAFTVTYKGGVTAWAAARRSLQLQHVRLFVMLG